MNDLALLLDLFGNSEENKLLLCLQRHRNGGLNSGQKSAIIVTDAFDQVNYCQTSVWIIGRFYHIGHGFLKFSFYRGIIISPCPKVITRSTSIYSFNRS